MCQSKLLERCYEDLNSEEQFGAILNWLLGTHRQRIVGIQLLIFR